MELSRVLLSDANMQITTKLHLNSYRLGIRKYVAASSKSKAMVAISDTCLFPFLTGNPDATIYESPIVSTLYTS